MRVLYLYWMKDDPDQVGAIAPRHASYWRELGLREYVGGPFGDRSGGLITFEVDSLEQARGHHRRRSVRAGGGAGELGGETVDAGVAVRTGPRASPRNPGGHVGAGATVGGWTG